VIEYAIFLRGLAQQRRARQKRNLAQGSLGVRMMPEHGMAHSARTTEKARDTTLDDEK